MARHSIHRACRSGGWLLAFVTLSGIASGQLLANDYEADLRRLVDEEVRLWLTDPVIVDGLRRQNDENAPLDQAAIDALDQRWRSEAEAGGGPLTTSLLERPMSGFLRQVKTESDGLFAELFVTDAKGLNAGQSDITSDYWQGDEAKWQRTFAQGADAVFVDEIEFDDSSEMFQSQVSVTIADPTTGEPLGAVTLGVNVENLVD